MLLHINKSGARAIFYIKCGAGLLLIKISFHSQNGECSNPSSHLARRAPECCAPAKMELFAGCNKINPFVFISAPPTIIATAYRLDENFADRGPHPVGCWRECPARFKLLCKNEVQVCLICMLWFSDYI